MASSRLERSVTNRQIGGVCAGIADYLALDPTWVRVAFVIGAVLTGGILILVYIALLIIMPLPGQRAPFGSPSAPAAASGDAATADPDATSTEVVQVDPAIRARDEERRRMTFGYVLIVLGAAFLLGQAGVFRLVQWQYIWPLVLIGIGVFLIVQRARQ